MPAKIASVKCLLKTCTKKFKDKRDMARHFLGRDHDRLCRDDRIIVWTEIGSGVTFYVHQASWIELEERILDM